MDRFERLEFVNFPQVDEIDNDLIVNHFERFFSKVNLRDSDTLKISFKEYSRGGLKKQHEVKAHLFLDGVNFSASEVNWQLIKTIQDVLKKLEKEVQRSTSK